MTPLSPIFARGAATIVNPPRPARRFGTFTTLTSCRRFAPFVRTFETIDPPRLVTRLVRVAARGVVVVRFLFGVDVVAFDDFLFLSMGRSIPIR